MWFPLGIKNFVAKKIIKDDCYELYVSDFARLWHTTLSNDELVLISQRLNPLLELSVHTLKEITSNLFQEEKVEKEIFQEDGKITLKLKSKSLGVKFLFQIVLHLQNEEVLYKEFTLPLLLVLIQMHNREKKLMKIISDKDAEIKEYKEEYGVIKSNYMATEPFNRGEFELQESITNICDINSFFECINSTIQTVKKEQLSRENSPEKCVSGSSQKCITHTKGAIFGEKNIKNAPKQCIKLEHETIKRRKKQSDTFKIKF